MRRRTRRSRQVDVIALSQNASWRSCGCSLLVFIALFVSCQVWVTKVDREATARRERRDRELRVREEDLRARFDACNPAGRRELVAVAVVACEASASEMHAFMRCVAEKLEVCGTYRGMPSLPSSDELYSCERHTRHPDRRCAHQRRALARNWRSEFDAALATWAAQEWIWEDYRFFNRRLVEQ